MGPSTDSFASASRLPGQVAQLPPPSSPDYSLISQYVSQPAGNGNVSIWGTQPDAIDEAEDRDRWMALLTKLDIRQPAGGLATNEEQALQIANSVSACRR